MQQALQRSSLVPSGFVVESAYYEGDKSAIAEALACVHPTERFPDVSIAVIGDA
jgi:hypothetical protein